MQEQGPLFMPLVEEWKGANRYTKKRKQDKDHKVVYNVKYSKPISKSKRQIASYIYTSMLVIYKTANEIGRLYNITGGEVMIITAIREAEYSFSTLVNQLFYFGNNKANPNRVAYLVEKGFMVYAKNQRGTRIAVNTEKGDLLCNHFVDLLCIKLENAGIE